MAVTGAGVKKGIPREQGRGLRVGQQTDVGHGVPGRIQCFQLHRGANLDAITGLQTAIRTMGLIVDEIVDIVEEHLNIELASTAPGLIGTAVVAGRATEVVDASHYLDKAFGDWFKTNSTSAFGTDGGRQSILLVDDSSFFRNLLSPVLSTAGYEVTTAEDAETALRMREAGRDFDVIVSDIEMPGMSGFDFAEEVRADKRWKDTPLVALSSHHTSEDVDRGRTVGFSAHVAKLDRSALLQSITQTLSQGD